MAREAVAAADHLDLADDARIGRRSGDAHVCLPFGIQSHAGHVDFVVGTDANVQLPRFGGSGRLAIGQALVEEIGPFALAPHARQLADFRAALPGDAVARFGQSQVALDQAAIGRAVCDVERAADDAGDRLAARQTGSVQLDRDVHRETALRRQPNIAARLHRAIASAPGKVTNFQMIVREAAIEPHLRHAGAEALILVRQAVGAHHAIESRVAQAAVEIGRDGQATGQLLIGQTRKGKQHIGRTRIANASAQGCILQLLRPGCAGPRRRQRGDEAAERRTAPTDEAAHVAARR